MKRDIEVKCAACGQGALVLAQGHESLTPQDVAQGFDCPGCEWGVAYKVREVIPGKV